MKDKLRKLFAQIFLTHLGRLFFVAAPLMLVGGIMSPNGTIGELIYDYNQGGFWHVLFYIGIAIFLVEGAIMFYWMIRNTIGDIRAWWNRRKKK
jgi:hypothetical protein